MLFVADEVEQDILQVKVEVESNRVTSYCNCPWQGRMPQTDFRNCCY